MEIRLNTRESTFPTRLNKPVSFAQRLERVRLVAALEDLDLSRSKRKSKIPKSWRFERRTGHIVDSKTLSQVNVKPASRYFRFTLRPRQVEVFQSGDKSHALQTLRERRVKFFVPPWLQADAIRMAKCPRAGNTPLRLKCQFYRSLG